MIGKALQAITGALGKRGTTIAGAVLVAIVSAALFTWWIGDREDAAVSRHEASVGVEIERSARDADADLVARERARAADAAVARKEFDNATEALPREGLTRRQRIDLCLELRDAGIATVSLAECRDVPAGAETGP